MKNVQYPQLYILAALIVFGVIVALATVGAVLKIDGIAERPPFIIWVLALCMMTAMCIPPPKRRRKSMGARPATPLESLLGIEKAKACEDEIKSRSHRDDTPELRESLVKEILGRHLLKGNMQFSDIINCVPFHKKSAWQSLIQILVKEIYEANEESYQVDKNQKSR